MMGGCERVHRAVTGMCRSVGGGLWVSVEDCGTAWRAMAELIGSWGIRGLTADSSGGP